MHTVLRTTYYYLGLTKRFSQLTSPLLFFLHSLLILCLFSSCSGLPAVMQSLARKNEWPLDKVNLTVDVTKKFKEEFNQPAREGAYIYGLYMEGRQTVFYFLFIVGQHGGPAHFFNFFFFFTRRSIAARLVGVRH